MRKRNLIAFLDTEPPRDAESLCELFVGRERELAKTIEILEGVCQHDPYRILVITGLARVGKSHLLNRAILEVKRSFQAVVSMRITPGHGGERSVLREMLGQVTAQLHESAEKKGVKGPDGKPVLEPLLETRRVYSEAIAGQAAEIQVSEATTIGSSLKRQLGGSFKTSALALFGGPEIGAEARRETGTREGQITTRQVKVSGFHEEALCELIALAHKLIRQQKPRWQTLLVIDDFDILHRSQTGSFNPVPLMRQLFNLAQVDGLHVVTTVREDTYGQYHQKVFYRITKTASFDRDEPLLEAYQRRVQRFHGGQSPFDENLVEGVACRTEGRIGVFFEWLKDLHEDGVTADLKGWFTNQWEASQRIQGEAAALISNAAQSQGGSLPGEDAATIRKTSLKRFTLEDYSSLDNMRVDPLVRSFLLEIEEGA